MGLVHGDENNTRKSEVTNERKTGDDVCVLKNSNDSSFGTTKAILARKGNQKRTFHN